MAKKLEKQLEVKEVFKPTKCELEFSYEVYKPPFFGRKVLQLSHQEMVEVVDNLDKDL